LHWPDSDRDTAPRFGADLRRRKDTMKAKTAKPAAKKAPAKAPAKKTAAKKKK
jgi:hypothetical protein